MLRPPILIGHVLAATLLASCTWGPAPPSAPGPLPPPPVAPSILPPRAQTTEVLPPEPVAPPAPATKPAAPSAAVAPLPSASAIRPTPPAPPARLPMTDDNGAVISGQDGFQAQRAAKELACEVNGQPVLIDKGAGFESYAIRCADGRSLTFRCSLGNCRQQR